MFYKTFRNRSATIQRLVKTTGILRFLGCHPPPLTAPPYGLRPRLRPVCVRGATTRSLLIPPRLRAPLFRCCGAVAEPTRNHYDMAMRAQLWRWLGRMFTTSRAPPSRRPIGQALSGPLVPPCHPKGKLGPRPRQHTQRSREQPTQLNS